MKMLTTALAIFVLVGGSASASVQQGNQDSLLQIIPDVNFQGADGSTALRRVATLVGLRIEIEPSVHGVVTLSRKGETAETVLRLLAECIDADFFVENGIVKVFRKGAYGIPEEVEAFFDRAATGDPARRTSLNDVLLPEALQSLLGNEVPYRIAPGTEAKIKLDVDAAKGPDTFCQVLRQSGLRFRVQSGILTVYRPAIPTARTFEYRNVHVRSVLRLLFLDEGLPYSISPEVQGTVSVSVRNLSFEEALHKIARQVGARYRLEEGRWHIDLVGNGYPSFSTTASRGSR